MPKLLDFEEFCEPLKEVTSIKIMDKRRFHRDGLFSEYIFGPVKNYTCQCGIYHGASKSGSTCSICDIDIVNSDERRRRFAKIILPIPVINPVLFDIVSKLGGSSIKKVIDELMKSETTVMYEDGNSFKLIENDDLPKDMRKWEGIEAIQHLVEQYSKDFDDDSEWSMVRENIDKLFIRQIIVLPPDLRPASKGVEKNNQIVDQINRYYMQILMKKHIMSDTMINIKRDKKLFYHYFRQLQKDVNELYEHILEKLSKKKGLIRGNILGKRLDFSGRAVIAPDPTLELDQCSLPYLMVLELYKLQIAKKLILIDRFQLLNEAIDFVDECHENNNDVLFAIVEEITKNEVCFLNRQPTLHRPGMSAFKIKISMDTVIKIHPLVCPGFNADFDGDQMAVYIPISEECKQEALDKCLITKTLSDPANGNLTTTPSQDIVLGLYTLSNGSFDSRLEKSVSFRGQEVPERVKLINECFPEDYPIVDKIISKNELYEILNDIKDKYDPEITKNVLDNIKKIGFKYSTLFGATISLDGCYISGVDKIRKAMYSSGDVNKQLENINSKLVGDFLKSSFTYAYLIESGARGSWDQARQLVLSRGFISNFSGEILPLPIKNSLVDGLTEEEFFYSTYGARKGLLDVALNTANSGYLSRKLIFACANLQFDVDLEDCGTKDLLDVFVKNAKKARMLIGKWMLGNDGNLCLITKENYTELINKSIQVRSPVFCKSEKLCKKCYGEMYKYLNTRFVGVIAAQSLGECNTQLVLRTFHTSFSKSTQIIDVNNTPIRMDDLYDKIKNKGEDVFTFSCSPDGKIETSQILDVFKDHITDKMIRITLDNDEFIEVTPEHKMFMRDGSYMEARYLKINDSLMPFIKNYNNSYLNQIQDNHKVKNIEFITLEKEEEFYDLTVDSEHSNFPLAAGVFVHNSGVAQTKAGSTDMKQQDVVNDLALVSKLLHQFDSKSGTVGDLISALFDVYNENKAINHTHFECIASQLMWVEYNKWRLLENRSELSPSFYSVQKVPSMESWLLGLAFSNPKRHILRGIFNKGNYTGILDKILRGELIE